MTLFPLKRAQPGEAVCATLVLSVGKEPVRLGFDYDSFRFWQAASGGKHQRSVMETRGPEPLKKPRFPIDIGDQNVESLGREVERRRGRGAGYGKKDFAGARCGGGREEGSPVPLSDEVGVRACKALSRLCIGVGAWVIMCVGWYFRIGMRAWEMRSYR
jgi:hypothetical protein